MAIAPNSDERRPGASARAVRRGKVLSDHAGLQKAIGAEGLSLLHSSFLDEMDSYGSGAARDVYVACFSEHNPDNQDGLLSMWRAYGANGQGAAIIFDTAALKNDEDSPILLVPVTYVTESQREQWVSHKLDSLARLWTERPTYWNPGRSLDYARVLFQRIKIAAIATKHAGFAEEREWRAVYMREQDVANKYESCLSYFVSEAGYEPKLKLPLDPMLGSEEVWLKDLVKMVLLGPSHGSVLAVNAVKRMLASAGHQEISGRVNVSKTPYRPTSRR